MLQNKNFTKGINSDIADEYLPEGMDRSRLNVRVLATNEGNDLCVETILGNTLVTYKLPNGANEVIGQYEWKEGRKNYAFVYNEYPRDTPNQHQIYEYDQITNTISPVLIDNIQGESDKVLRFRKENLITGISIYIEDGDVLLGWTDNYKNPLDENDYNEPKMINVTKAKLYMQGNYVNGYKDVAWQEFRLYLTHIKQPPQAPTYEWEGTLYNSHDAFLVKPSNYNLLPSDGIHKQEFDNIYANDPALASYNIATYEGTIQPDGDEAFYNVIVKRVVYTDTDATDVVMYLYLNGVAIAQTPSTTVYAATATILSTGVNPIMLYNGDVLDARISVGSVIGGNPLVLLGGASKFEALFIMPKTTPINYLFKKLFAFKVQNVHLNNELSSLSPQSKYVFPETALGINSSGEDFSYQNSDIKVHIPTGIASVRKLRLYVKVLGAMTTGDTQTEIGYCLVTELDKDKLNKCRHIIRYGYDKKREPQF